MVAAWGRWRRLAIGTGLAVIGFALTSPFVILHLGEAAGDVWRVQRDARAGWLGFEHDHVAPIAFVERLWEGFGPALIIAAVGLVVALVRRTRADLVLAVFVLIGTIMWLLHRHQRRRLLRMPPGADVALPPP